MSNASNDVGQAVERGGKNNSAGGSNAAGNVLTNDVGTGTKTVTSVRLGGVEGEGTAGTVGTSLVGTYGTLTIRANGSYTYVPNQVSPAVQALNVGDMLTESFNYTLSSGGTSDVAVLTIQIGGANDGPVAANDTASTPKTETGTGNVLLNDKDVDTPLSGLAVTGVRTGGTEGSGTAGAVGTALKGTFGTLILNSDGTYTYVADSSHARVKSLAEGQTLTDTFNYTTSDGGLTDIAKLAITIRGVSTPVEARDDAGSALERGGKGNTVPGSNATGNVLANDGGTSKTVTGVRTGAVEGDGTAGTIGQTLVGTYGTLTLRADGTYTYTINNTNPAVQALSPGQTLTDSFNYTLSAGGLTDIAVLNITINGANDAPTAVNDAGSLAKQAGSTTGNVLLNETDVDTPLSQRSVSEVRTGGAEGSGTLAAPGTALAGLYGTLTLNADGTYTYVVNAANARVAALQPGQTLTDSFNYQMSDGQFADRGVLRITIGSVVVVPVAADDAGSATESGGIANGTPGASANGNVLANDSPSTGLTVVEVRRGATEGAGTAGVVGNALVGVYGTLTLNADGTYTYVPHDSDPAVEALKAADTLTDSFNYTVSTGSGVDRAVLTITINGANDAATIAVDPSVANDRSVTEDGGVNNGTAGDPAASGKLLVSDVDAGEAAFSAPNASALDGIYGTFTFNPATGLWTYTLDNARAATQALGSGETVTDTLTVTSADGTASYDIAVAVNGAGDTGIVIDGALADWSPVQRVDRGGVAGTAVYGTVQGDSFAFAIGSDRVIGPNTTIWLDTDLDAGTGFQVFGTGGVEYAIEIDADGVARLYSTLSGGGLVGEIAYGIGADGRAAEFLIQKSLLGNVPAVNAFVDVNNLDFLPTDYSAGGYRVGSLPVTSVGSITLDGSLSDWSAASRLNTAADSPAGYDIYGKVEDGTFLFALSADSGIIGPKTTVWLNTDRDASTGYQIFGSTGGAEYKVEIGIDGTARLFAAETGNFVANLAYNYGPGQRSIEIALPANLMAGDPIGANVLVDINDNAFLPSDYGGQPYSVGPLSPPLETDPSTRIAIVYSETSANNFYYKTAYGQLFMAAQSQAMQAGVPFDLLSEADLKSAANLVKYDAIVFPGLQNVKAADLAAITRALTIASKEYGVGLIAGGNFLTNDENGNAFSGDSYARMKSLLGVTLEGFGSTDGITLKASGGTNPILDGYTPGEVVGTYSNTSYLEFRDVSGTGQTLFRQTAGGADRAAVIATDLGGRNVAFATDAIIGNNNILGKAIDWATQSTDVDVSLSMTRFESLFQSRTDMDQSQETFDVIDNDPGIYDVLLPILADWKSTYNFVGSYFINVGLFPPDQDTDWSVSRAYYQQILGLGNEIGTHSYTHPSDTNLLVPTAEARQDLRDLLQRVDPSSPDAVDPKTLTLAERNLLATSVEFQFRHAKEVIERELGITVRGAALPGAPEPVQAAKNIIPFFDYITGGYSSTGAGYPNAFGFLTPGDTGKVYLAPNMSFDFTMIGFQKIGVEAARAKWLKEFSDLNAQAETPIIQVPWHDYGPTNWDLGDPVKLNYDISMWTALLDAAVASGTEFVTAADLADRIKAFQASKLTMSQSGNVVTATVTSADAGKFALDVGDDRTSIASVARNGESWFAFDDNKVLLPKGGGTFEVTLGAPADATHLAALPMRGDLRAVSGNGTDLTFTFVGEGNATVALKTQGGSVVVARGADGGTLAGGELSLAFRANGSHTASVDYVAGGQVAGGAGNEVIIGGSGNDTINGAGGDDVLYGRGGEDVFVFDADGGRDVVDGFASSGDRLLLTGFTFANVDEARAAFTATAAGLLLTAEGNSLLLQGLGNAGLAATDIVLDSLFG